MNERMQRGHGLFRLLCSALLVAGIGAIIGACADGGDGPCVTAGDCDGTQICQGGVCVEPSEDRQCREDLDCGEGEICSESGVCEAEQADADDDDIGLDAGDDDTGDDDAGLDTGIDTGGDDDTGVDMVFDTAPVVTVSVPADGATGVALDAVIDITFDQPMRSTSFTGNNVRVLAWDDDVPLPRQIEYDAETWTVRLRPLNEAGNFRPNLSYSILLDRNIRGDNDINLADDIELTFTTENWAGMDDYAALAEAYAPVVYAEVNAASSGADLTPRIDWFTAVDYDGDYDASNNRQAAITASTDLPATLYWNVIETETHHLIQYFAYYPLAVDDEDEDIDDVEEHDFSYLLVAVQKLDDDPLGQFGFAEGLGASQVWAFGRDDYVTTSCGGDAEPVCEGVDEGSADEMFMTFDAGDLEAVGDGDDVGRRFPWYLTRGLHASCYLGDFGDRGIAQNFCVHDTAGFDEGDTFSRILRAGDAADNWTRDSAEQELTYELASFLETFWAQRANEALFDDSRDYQTPTGGAEGGTRVPTSLNASNPDDVGSLTRRPPFLARPDIVRDCDGCSHNGLWFADPTYELEGHITFTEDTWNGTYCFNPFLGIDRRDTGGCLTE